MRTAYVERAIALALAIGVAAALGAGAARAAPPQARVVLADPDPELLRAVQSALAPWRLEVVARTMPPADELDAATSAAALSARFIVWRREGALVVFDRERGAAAQRASAAGPLDAVDAAAAALTVKTLMRLPPPPPSLEDEAEPDAEADPEVSQAQAAAPALRSGPELRAHAGLGGRFAPGDTERLGGRVRAGVMLRPLASLPLRIGATFDVGATSEVKRASFQGGWSDWSALALASWTLTAGAWELEPELGGGVTFSSLDGTRMDAGHHDTARFGTLHAGASVRRRLGRYTVGGALGADMHVGIPTYTRVGSSARIFEAPQRAVGFGLVIAADFGGPY